MIRKLSLVLFFGLLFGAVSRAQELLDQPITVHLEEQSLEEALYLLMDQYSIPLSFSNDIIPSKSVRVRMVDRPLEGVLDFLLRDTDLSFRRLGRQIVLYRADYQPPEARVPLLTISGYVEDGESGERLIGASIYDALSGRGATTNEYGFFSFSLPPGPVRLHASYLGYRPEVSTLDLERDQFFRFQLYTSLVLEEVVVIAADSNAHQQRLSAYAPERLLPSDISGLPLLAGEPDVVRTLHFLPGVQTGTDGIGGIFVRGGDAGHNLVLLDGVPVYNLAHGAGLFSIFNTDVIKHVRFTKGPFPARYGGRLASVLDVRTRDGNNQEFHGQGGLGLLAARLSLEGPIVRGKSSFLISGRHSLVNSYLAPVSRNLKKERGEQGAAKYSFYDLNAKFNFTLSERDRFYLSLYSGNDDFLNFGKRSKHIGLPGEAGSMPVTFRHDLQYREGLRWGNQVAAFRWNHLFGPKLFSNLTLTYSKLGVDVGYATRDSLIQEQPMQLLGKSLDYGRYRSSIEDIGARFDFEWTPGPRHRLRFGGQATYHRLQPGAVQYDEETEELLLDPDASGSIYHSLETALYLDDDIQLSETVLLNAGLRSAFWSADRTYFSLEPRLSVNWTPAPRTNLYVNAGMHTQFLHLLSSSNFGLPTDLWVPTTGAIPPQRAVQAALGINRKVGRQYAIGAEAYYKRMDNLATYEDGAYFLDDWRQNVTRGDGRAYGLELLLRKSEGRTTGWIAYSLSWTDRRFDNINEGQRFPFRYDRRHDLKIVLQHTFSERISISADWLFGTGLAFSFPQYTYDIHYPDIPVDERGILVYNGKNDYRMPYYHRLDVAFNAVFPGSRFEQGLSLGFYNLYNRDNPLYYDVLTTMASDGEQLLTTSQVNQVNFIPVMPYLNYSVKF